MQLQSCLLFHFRSCKKKKKERKFPLVVQLYHTAGAGQCLNNSSDSCLPVKGKSTLHLSVSERDHDANDRCIGKFLNESLGGEGAWVGARADIEPKPIFGILDANISVLVLPVVLFSQRSRMFLFLIIARPDAKFSSATCWRSEKANSWFLLRWTPGE